MKEVLSSVSFILLIIVVSIFTLSCTGNEKENIKADAAGQKIASNEPEISDENGAARDRRTNDENISEIGEPEGREFLLYSESRTEAFLPYDFSIGPLEKMYGDGENQEILQTAVRFLDAVKDNRVETGLIYSGQADFVEKNLLYELKILTPEEYRIGRIMSGEQPVWAKVRLIYKKGSAEGIIYFKKEKNWKIYDFHISFEDMLEPYNPADEGYLWEAVSAE